MKDSRLVYSTETGRICAECGNPASACACKKKRAPASPKSPDADRGDGIVRIQREVKGRKGKTVTAVYGVCLAPEELEAFSRALKRRCGAGGSVKDGVVIVQGDHRQTILKEVRKQGYTAKFAGG